MTSGGGRAKDDSDGNQTTTPTSNSRILFIWGILGAGHRCGGKSWSRAMAFPRFMICVLLLLCFLYFLYTFKLLFSSSLSHRQLSCSTTTTSAIADKVVHLPSSNISVRHPPLVPSTATASGTPAQAAVATGLQHIVFGIAASASLWDASSIFLARLFDN